MTWNGVVELREIRGVMTLIGVLSSPDYHTNPYVMIEPPHEGQRESFGLWHNKLLAVGTKFTWTVDKNGEKLSFPN